MSRYPLLPVRLWRSRPWSSSPLMRVSDRIEALVRIVAVVVILIAVPVAGAVGTAAYTWAAERIRAENATKVVVPATVIAKPERIVTLGGHGMSEERFEAALRWDRGGRSGAATMEVPEAVAQGDEVPVWLGADGKPTAPPRQSGAAAVDAMNAGLALLVGIWVGALALVSCTVRLLSTRHDAGWDREWRQISRSIGKEFQ